MQGLNKMDKIVLSNQTVDVVESKVYYISSLTNSNLVVEKNVEASIFVTDIKDTLNIKVLENASVKLNVISSLVKHDINIDLDSNAKLSFLGVNLDSSIENLNINLNGYKANAKVDYLSVIKEDNATFNTTINHNYKETYSNVYNVGVSLKSAHITFNTLSKINKGMAKSEASQLTRGIMMESDSIITSEPILKIDEFDIKANHGTALGRMSDDELFYLMSRGLSKEDSYKLILNGLINPIVDNIIIEEEKKNISTQIFALI